ncbi:MAG TPA: hypothetical protein VNH18_01425 [Bryobacteraceae bacterium]|nr:hypothetical protein [Bryobacteraceae bacterium]
MTIPKFNAVQLESQDSKNAGVSQVDARPAGFWNMIIPYVFGPRLLRITVHGRDDKGQTVPKRWHLSQNEEIGADGQPAGKTTTGILVTTAARGALVGKLGGSTADLPDSATGTTVVPYRDKKVFAVGSSGVIPVAAADSGPLFLTMNDSPEGFENHSGSLWVLIEESSL